MPIGKSNPSRVVCPCSRPSPSARSARRSRRRCEVRGRGRRRRRVRRSRRCASSAACPSRRGRYGREPVGAPLCRLQRAGGSIDCLTVARRPDVGRAARRVSCRLRPDCRGPRPHRRCMFGSRCIDDRLGRRDGERGSSGRGSARALPAMSAALGARAPRRRSSRRRAASNG